MAKKLNMKAVQPLFDELIVTAHEDPNQLVDGSKILIDPNKLHKGVMDIQQVVAKGDAVRGVEVGDYIIINWQNYEIKKQVATTMKDGNQQYENQVVGMRWQWVVLNDVDHLKINQRDIYVKVLDFEWIEEEDTPVESTVLDIPETKPELIIPNGKLIL